MSVSFKSISSILCLFFVFFSTIETLHLNLKPFNILRIVISLLIPTNPGYKSVVFILNGLSNVYPDPLLPRTGAAHPPQAKTR